MKAIILMLFGHKKIKRKKVLHIITIDIPHVNY